MICPLATKMKKSKDIWLSSPHDSLYRYQIPMTPKEYRVQFWGDGKHSVYSNLPHPPTKYIGDHAYVSLIDIIADLKGIGLKLDVINASTPPPTVFTISQSKFCSGMFDRASKLHPNKKNFLSIAIQENKIVN